MAVYGQMVLTTQGQALYAKAQSGTQLNFTRMQLGSGQLASGQDPSTLTALITPIGYFNINSKTTSGNTASIKGLFDNSSLNSSTYSCELGLFATDPTLGEILYAYANAGSQGDNIPPISNGPFSKQYQVNVTVGNATSVTITVPAGTYIPESEKGVSVATLDSTANVPLNQLGNAQKQIAKGTTAPASPSADDLWIDESATPNIMKRYDAPTTAWVKVTPTLPSEIGAAPTSLAQMVKLTQDNGHSLNPTVTDFNSLTTTGEYYFGSALTTNGPVASSSDAGVVIVRIPSANVITQQVIYTGGNAKLGYSYTRSSFQGVWGAWDRYAQVNQDFVNSFGTNGYQKLPGGMILQWGKATSVPSGTTTNVTLPIAFPTEILNVIPGLISASGSTGYVPVIGSLSQIGLIQTQGSARDMYYWAIGN